LNNPYQSLNWRTALRVASTTHMHISTPWESPTPRAQIRLDNAYRHGLRHFPISNYYPSAPCLADTRLSDFRLRQAWPATRHGVPVPPPINWNDLITWKDELPEEIRRHLPFKETGPIFSRLPADVLLSKNAEHHSFTNMPCHVTAPGSAMCSGHFDARGQFALPQHGYPLGYNGPWQDAFAEAFRCLDVPDGGGVVIAHPTWSRLSDAQVEEMLAFDPRVLGIEIYNDGVAIGIRNGRYPPEEGEPDPGYSIHMWDRILSKGRRCFGFCVPDHAIKEEGGWLGRVMLLPPAFTDADCLRAYRQGRFYACLKGSGLDVSDFAANPRRVAVTLNVPAHIKFIADGRTAHTAKGFSAEWEIPLNDGAPAVTYVRVEVEDESGERLFLQPVMYRGTDGQRLA